MLEGTLGYITGPPGSGKSYSCAHWLVNEIFPFSPQRKVVSNIPLFVHTDRCTLTEFESGWLPPGETAEERLDTLRDSIVIMDEAQRVIAGGKHATELSRMFSLSRKYGVQWVLISQTKDNFPKEWDDLVEVWVECANGRALRDDVFGFRIGDLQELKAKITGRYREFFQWTEYIKRNRRWAPLNKVPFRTWFRQEVGDAYDTKSGQAVDDEGRALVVHEYQRLSFFRLLMLVAIRNAHVMPLFLARNAVVVGPIVFGLGGFWLFARYRESILPTKPKGVVAVVTPAERVVAMAKSVTGAAGPGRQQPGKPVTRRVITWGLILCLLCGCATEKGTTKIAGGLPHVGRAAALPDLRVAAYGGGHSLDELLADAGVKSATGLEVDGAVGKDVLAYGQAAGYELQGDTLVPARKRPVAVPQELGSVPGSVNVGGMPVKLVDQGEVDRWRELGAVVHEAYATELLIVSVASSSSRELSGVLSGNGGVSVAYPAGTSWSGKANVVLTLNGSSVRARQICHPVLTSAPGAAATVHVGERIPVLLSKSTVSGGGVATTSVGSTIQYIQTGTEVTLQPARVSATQCRLVGKISVSEQVATVNGVPSTSERVLSVDHLVVMDAWTVLGRLDAAQRRHARSWIAVGGLWSESDDTFVVVARVVQVHRDTGLHGTESAGPGPVLRVVDSDKPAAVPGPGKPVKPSGVKDLPPGAVPVTPGGATSKVETPVGQEAAKSPEKPKPAVPSPR